MLPRSRWGWCWAAKRASGRQCSASAACCGALATARRGSTKWWSRRRQRSRPPAGAGERVLTKRQRVYHWDRRGSSISSDRLPEADLGHLERALAVYRPVRASGSGACGVPPGSRSKACARIASRRSCSSSMTPQPTSGLAARRRQSVACEFSSWPAPATPCSTAPMGAVVAQVFGEAPRLDELVALLYADYEFPAYARSPATTPQRISGRTTTSARPRPYSIPRSASTWRLPGTSGTSSSTRASLASCIGSSRPAAATGSSSTALTRSSATPRLWGRLRPLPGRPRAGSGLAPHGRDRPAEGLAAADLQRCPPRTAFDPRPRAEALRLGDRGGTGRKVRPRAGRLAPPTGGDDPRGGRRAARPRLPVHPRRRHRGRARDRRLLDSRSTSQASSASWGRSARPTSWSRCGGPWPSRPAPCPRTVLPLTASCSAISCPTSRHSGGHRAGNGDGGAAGRLDQPPSGRAVRRLRRGGLHARLRSDHRRDRHPLREVCRPRRSRLPARRGSALTRRAVAHSSRAVTVWKFSRRAGGMSARGCSSRDGAPARPGGVRGGRGGGSGPRPAPAAGGARRAGVPRPLHRARARALPRLPTRRGRGHRAARLREVEWAGGPLGGGEGLRGGGGHVRGPRPHPPPLRATDLLAQGLEPFEARPLVAAT